jgi:hypothetical protein
VPNYLLVYRDGATPADDEEMAAAMERWEHWFDSLGDAVVDWGNPLGGAATVSPGGAVVERGTSKLTGYSIISAAGLAAATDAAKGCPVLVVGGSVEVYEVTTIG